jgi:hypothetical protein
VVRVVSLLIPLHHTVTVSATPLRRPPPRLLPPSVSPHQFASPSSALNPSPRARERGGRPFLDADGGASTATTAAVVAAGGPPTPQTARPAPTSAHRLRTRRRTATRPAVERAVVLQGTGAHCPPRRRCGRIAHSPQRSTACHCALALPETRNRGLLGRCVASATGRGGVAAASPHSTSSSSRAAGGSGSGATLSNGRITATAALAASRDRSDPPPNPSHAPAATAASSNATSPARECSRPRGRRTRRRLPRSPLCHESCRPRWQTAVQQLRPQAVQRRRRVRRPVVGRAGTRVR